MSWHLLDCIQSTACSFAPPQCKKYMDQLKWSSGEPPRWSGAGACEGEKSVMELGLLSLEKGRLGLIHGKIHEDKQAVEQVAQ